MPDRSVFKSGTPDAGAERHSDGLTAPTDGALFGVPGLPKHGGLEHLTVTEDGWTAQCPSCGQSHRVAAGTKTMAWSWLVAHMSNRHG